MLFTVVLCMLLLKYYDQLKRQPGPFHHIFFTDAKAHFTHSFHTYTYATTLTQLCRERSTIIALLFE